MLNRRKREHAPLTKALFHGETPRAQHDLSYIQVPRVFFSSVSVYDTCMTIIVSVQDSDGYYTGDPIMLPSGNPIKCHEDFLSLLPTSINSMFPPKRFDISPPDWVCVLLLLLSSH